MYSSRSFVAATVFCLLGLLSSTHSHGQRPTTFVRFPGSGALHAPRRVPTASSTNFVVYANDQVMANRVAKQAEMYRKQLAIEWLGHELPDWNQPCPIQVNLAMDAGGETSFSFLVDDRGNGVPVDWDMKIFGPHDRLLDAVLPHEITHTIFATHFGRPLPRWADEGACTTVEHISERNKNHAMLIRFLSATPSRGIAFNRMFTLKNYPHDILPLYAQGYSLAKFLILQKGKPAFLDYLATGMQNESTMPPLVAWNRATEKHFGYQDLSELQLKWEAWVRAGSQAADLSKFSNLSNPAATYVSARSNPSDRPGQVWQSPPPKIQPDRPSRGRSRLDNSDGVSDPRASARVAAQSDSWQTDSWYSQQMRKRVSSKNKASTDQAEIELIRESRLQGTVWR